MNKTILIADDSPVQAIMLRRTLTQAGFQVVVAKNGLEALDLIKKQDIHLIISDINMPKMDGYEFCRTIKGDTLTYQIPFILCTTLSDPSNLIKGLEVGANNYITKPWNEENLLTLIDQLLNPSMFLRNKKNSLEEVFFNGKDYKIQTGFQEIINFLLSTYQNIQKQNEELTHLREEIQKAYNQIASSQKEQEQILFNILPEAIAQELMAYGTVEPMRYEEASVMFIDFVSFTKSAMQTSPQDLVGALEVYFEKFDEIMSHRKLERIKTIGDGYMCVGGIPNINSTHAIDCALAALDIQKFIEEKAEEIQNQYHVSWKVRIGINTGVVIAGVCGKKRFAYDVWGEAVNLASRMESYSEPNQINISAHTYLKIKDLFICQPRGDVIVKNKKGIEEMSIEMYFLKGINSTTPLK